MQPTEADRLDALLGEPGQPRIVPGGVVRAAVYTRVLEPQLDVLREVGDIPLHHPCVATVAGQPGADSVLPGRVRSVDPVGEDLAPAALRQVPGCAGDHSADDLVAWQPGAAVDEPFSGPG